MGQTLSEKMRWDTLSARREACAGKPGQAALASTAVQRYAVRRQPPTAGMTWADCEPSEDSLLYAGFHVTGEQY